MTKISAYFLSLFLLSNAGLFGQNVGIGTTTPANTLSVNGNTDITGKLGIGTTTPAGELHIKSILTSNGGILDQQQTISIGGVGSLVQWQSFTAGSTGLLTRVDLKVSSPIIGSSSPGTIKIFMGEGNTGALLSTTSVTFQNVYNTFQSFALSSFPAVVAGNKYTIEFIVPAQNVGGWVNFNTDNPYLGGKTNNSNPSYDYLFKTYVASELADGLVVVDGKTGIGTNNPANKLSVNGNSDITGSLGVGTITPAAKLHVTSSNTGLRIDVPPTQTAFSIGGAGSVQIDAIGIEGGRLLINDNGNMGIGTPTPTTTLDVNGGIRTKYSGTAVFDVVGNAVRTLSITIPTLPADWNNGNTIVIVTNADGVDGIIRQAKLTSTTNIEIKYIQDINGNARFNWVVFKM